MANGHDLKCFTTLVRFTHSCTDGGGCHARCQLLIRTNLGFSVLLKDTLTCRQVEPATFRLLDDPALPPELQLPHQLMPSWSELMSQNP